VALTPSPVRRLPARGEPATSAPPVNAASGSPEADSSACEEDQRVRAESGRLDAAERPERARPRCRASRGRVAHDRTSISSRVLLLTCAIACAVAVPAVPARADGDPASDVLIQDIAYFPFPRAQHALIWRTLYSYLQAVNTSGYRIRVAIIGRPSDLGAYPQLFGQPRRYARLLAWELSYNYANRLLVVMPQGFAARRIRGGALARAVHGVALASHATPESLGQAALTVVRRLATAAGYRPGAPAGGGATTSTTATGASPAGATMAGSRSGTGLRTTALLAGSAAFVLVPTGAFVTRPRVRRRRRGRETRGRDARRRG
jgi:hypothetical protein